MINPIQELRRTKVEIKAITFDLDDTLWPILPVIIRAEEETNDWLKSNFPAVTKIMESSEIMNIRKEILLTLPKLRNDLSKLRKKYYEELGIRSGYSKKESIDLAKSSFKIFYKRRNEVRLFEGVEETLKELKKNYLLGVITNGNANLKEIGIDHYFDVFVSSETAKSLKPDPKIFNETVHQLELDPKEICHIGDHPINDVKGSYEIGMIPIWFNFKKEVWPLDEEIEYKEVFDWNQIKDTLI